MADMKWPLVGGGVVFVIVVALAAAFLVTAGLRSDVDDLKDQLARIEEQQTSGSKGLKTQLQALSTANLSVSYGNPQFDANAARDSQGQSGSLTLDRIVSGGKLTFNLTAERLPANRTYYLFVRPTKLPEDSNSSAQRLDIVRVGQIEVKDDGRADFRGSLTLAPGKYTLGGFLTHVDNGNGPFFNRIYLCLPSVTLLSQ